MRSERTTAAHRLWVWLALAASLLLPGRLQAQDALVHEYGIKVAYLYNFIRYIEWPPDAAAPEGGAIRIGIIGEPPVQSVFDPLNKKEINGRKLIVKQITSPADLASCQMIFVCASEKSRLPAILDQLKSSRALTVSEIDGFAAQGGVINFISERNKVRFEINPDAARRIGLTISSDLLKLAKLVKA